MEILAFIVGIVIGAAGGMTVAVWAGRAQIEKYRTQRNEMVGALERIESGEKLNEFCDPDRLPARIEGKLSDHAQAKLDKNAMQRHLRSLSSVQRYELEYERLRKGLPPLDPLDAGLSQHYKAAIIKLRIQYGKEGVA